MRIWSIHPTYLDSKGLVALWRESLLAQHVLLGKTKGYQHHPQLIRFKNHSNPVGAINLYLYYVYEEATARGYKFDGKKIGPVDASLPPITVTEGQLAFEIQHLKNKLKTRDPKKLKAMTSMSKNRPHPLFTLVKGNIADWEKI